MKMIISNGRSVYEQQLKKYISNLDNPILFDITLGRPSERILTLSDNGEYILSYSRPLFTNIFRPPLAEYEFIFSLNDVEQADRLTITGKVRLKRYIIGAILFVSLIILYKGYDVLFQAAPFNWFFLVIMPLILVFYLVIEYWFFKIKIKKFLKSVEA